MTTLIENAVALADIARVMKTTTTRVEADARDLNLFVGPNWSGKPALSVTDAAALVSGDARRANDHSRAHARWRASIEDWESAREQARERAFGAAFDAARRRGTGDPIAAHTAAQAASVAIIEFERATPQPTFGVVETSRLSQMKSRVKEVVR